jgi:Icc-related predicted phosphoesterase
VIIVGGNHDFIPYTGWLSHYGADVHEITDQKPYVDLLGVRWAGFRQIPPLTGEWVGECPDLTPYVDRVRALNPDVLLTHAPPQGILDQEGYGSPELREWLLGGQHSVRAHFFGHAHAGYGSRIEGGVAFYNGACHCTVHDVDVL